MGTVGILFISIIVIILLVFFLRRPKTKKQIEEKSIEEKVRDMMAADKIIRFNSERERSEYESLRKSFYGTSAYNQEKKFESQAERNLIGIELEKAGRVDEAIPLYEQNVRENFIGEHPYKRLAIIYRSRKQFDDEIRILIRATRKFKGDNEFSMRLEKAKALKAKAEIESKTEKESHDPGHHQ